MTNAVAVEPVEVDHRGQLVLAGPVIVSGCLPRPG